MSADNPYQPPADISQPATPWPTEGAFRYGKWLVVHHTTDLPMLCLKTGEPVDMYVPTRLYCQGKVDDSVAPVGKTWSGRLMYEVGLPVGASWFGARHWIIAIAIIMGVVLYPAAALFALGSDSADKFLLLGMFTLMLVAFEYMVVDFAMRPFRLVSVKRGFLAIKGASQTYLRQLPPWPHQQTPWWKNPLGTGKYDLGNT